MWEVKESAVEDDTQITCREGVIAEFLKRMSKLLILLRVVLVPISSS